MCFRHKPLKEHRQTFVLVRKFNCQWIQNLVTRSSILLCSVGAREVGHVCHGYSVNLIIPTHIAHFSWSPPVDHIIELR